MAALRMNNREKGMQQFPVRAALLVASALMSIATAAKEQPVAPPPPDPKALELIQELALPENSTALRDLPGWRAPKRIVMSTANPNLTTASEQLDPLKAV